MQKEVQQTTGIAETKPIARESRGQFKKGISANPKGRGKGIPTQKTAIVKGFTDAMVTGGADKFKRELMKLKAKDYVNAYLALLEYSVPKKARVEHTSDSEGVQIIQVFVIGGKEITL